MNRLTLFDTDVTLDGENQEFMLLKFVGSEWTQNSYLSITFFLLFTGELHPTTDFDRIPMLSY